MVVYIVRKSHIIRNNENNIKMYESRDRKGFLNFWNKSQLEKKIKCVTLVEDDLLEEVLAIHLCTHGAHNYILQRFCKMKQYFSF